MHFARSYPKAALDMHRAAAVDNSTNPVPYNEPNWPKATSDMEDFTAVGPCSIVQVRQETDR